MVQLKSSITIGLIILIIQAFLIFDASVIFGSQAESIRSILIVYILMEALFIASFDLVLPTLRADPSEIIAFFLGFLVTVPIIVLPAFVPQSGEILKANLLNTTNIIIYTGLIFYTFIKAFVEETLFRGILSKPLGGIGSSLLFGAFHLAILATGGASLVSIAIGVVFLTGLGYFWYILYRNFGLLSSVGSHLAWNLGAVGLLASLFGA